MNPDQLYSDIQQALQSVEPGSQLDQVLQRWRGFDHIVRVREKWLLEGFVSFLQSHYELARAVDPSLEPGLPPQCFDPEAIARLFGLPVEEFTGDARHGDEAIVDVGSVGKPGRKETMRDVADFAHKRRPHITWKEIFQEWRQCYPDDIRVKNHEQIREAYRRYYRAKGRKNR